MRQGTHSRTATRGRASHLCFLTPLVRSSGYGPADDPSDELDVLIQCFLVPINITPDHCQYCSATVILFNLSIRSLMILRDKDRIDKFYFKSHMVKTYNISSNELVQATYKTNNK